MIVRPLTIIVKGRTKISYFFELRITPCYFTLRRIHKSSVHEAEYHH
jgi:hypothetical protein